MSGFERMQLEVESAVRAQGTMDRAVELIYGENDLDSEERAALWLLGWSMLPDEQTKRASRLARSRLQPGQHRRLGRKARR